MAKAVVCSMKLEPELRADLMAEAEADHRTASQVVRELMRDYGDWQREARERAAFLYRKVAAARISVEAGVGQSNEDVEAAFAARRSEANDAARRCSGC